MANYKAKKILIGDDTIELSGGVTSYNDLDNKPSIPSKVSELDNDSNFITNDVVGNLNDLSTTSKSNIVSSINEINSTIGDVNSILEDVLHTK